MVYNIYVIITYVVNYTNGMGRTWKGTFQMIVYVYVCTDTHHGLLTGSTNYFMHGERRVCKTTHTHTQLRGMNHIKNLKSKYSWVLRIEIHLLFAAANFIVVVFTPVFMNIHRTHTHTHAYTFVKWDVHKYVIHSHRVNKTDRTLTQTRTR